MNGAAWVFLAAAVIGWGLFAVVLVDNRNLVSLARGVIRLRHLDEAARRPQMFDQIVTQRQGQDYANLSRQQRLDGPKR